MDNSISNREIYRLAVPALISGIAEPLLSLADTAFVGHLPVLAKESLAAVGLTGAFLSMLIWILGQVRSAVSTIVSQYLGAGRINDILPLPVQAAFSVAVLSLLLIAVTYPLAPFIFRLYNAGDILLELSVAYYRIRVFGLPFTLVTFVVFGTFRGLQNTFYPMLIALTGTVLNVVLDYFLIFGIEGVIPAFHIEGAAYASVIAQFVMMTLAVLLLYRKTPVRLRLRFPFHREMKNLYRMVLHLFVRTLSLNVALYFGSAFAAKYGNTELAAYSIAIQIWFFYAFVIDGYSSAGNILAGKLYGGGQYKTLEKLGGKLLYYGIAAGVVLGGISLLFYHSFGALFIKDRQVLEVFESVFWIVAVMQPVNGVAFIYDGIFKGLGEMKYLRNVLLVATFAGFVPVLLWFDFHRAGVAGIWWAFFVWMLLRGGLLLVRFKKLVKRYNRS